MTRGSKPESVVREIRRKTRRKYSSEHTDQLRKTTIHDLAPSPPTVLFLARLCYF